MSQIGCLLMVAAETLEDKDMHLVGLPSLGVNKRMDILQLFSRINIVLILIGVSQPHSHNHLCFFDLFPDIDEFSKRVSL